MSGRDRQFVIRMHAWGLALVLIPFLTLAGLYNVLLPLWETPDEPAHVEFIRYIELHRSLPTAMPSESATTPTSVPGNEFVQVPAYYLLLSPILDWIWLPPGAEWHRNPYVTWPGHPNRLALAFHRTDEGWPLSGLSLFTHLGRLMSALFGLVTLVSTYTMAVLITSRRSAAFVATAFLAWSPEFLLASSRVGNDAFATAWSAVVCLACVWIVVRERPITARLLVLLGLLLMLTFLSKLNTVFLAPLVVITIALSELRARRPTDATFTRIIFKSAVVFTLPVLSVGTWWLLVGQRFGEIVSTQGGFGVARIGDVLPYVTIGRVASAISTLNLTWWGLSQFEYEIRWPDLVYVILGVSTVALVGAGVIELLHNVHHAENLPRSRLVTGLLVLATIPLVYATIAREIIPTIGYGAQARFVLPAAPVVGLLVAWGWARLSRYRVGRGVGVACLAVVLAIGAAAPFILFPQINAPTIPARLARNRAEAEGSALATFSNGVELLSVDGLPAGAQPGQTIPLTLHWRVAENPPSDFTVSIQLIKLPSDRVTGTDVTPFQETFPPRLWNRGELIDEILPVSVPETLNPGIFALRLGLYQLRGNSVEMIPITGDASHQIVDLAFWQVEPDPSDISTVHAIDAQFGPGLALTGYARETRGGDLRITLFWRTSQHIPTRLVISVQVLDPAGRLLAQHDGEPADGQLPTPLLTIGAVIRDDHAVAMTTLPPGAQTIVVVYDRESTRRVPVVVAGNTIGDYLALPPS